ncbi:hypothetical protein KCU59_g38, partial [Aureobasidium melanogenum]
MVAVLTDPRRNELSSTPPEMVCLTSLFRHENKCQSTMLQTRWLPSRQKLMDVWHGLPESTCSRMNVGRSSSSSTSSRAATS